MWILTGTLEKYPKMKVLFVEPGLGWLPWFFETLLDPRMHQHYEFPGVKKRAVGDFPRSSAAPRSCTSRRGLEGLLRVLRSGLPVLVDRLPQPGHLLAELAQAGR